jgi:hypothetical protein
MEFMNKIIIAVAAALCIGSVAQAQTVVYDEDFINGTAYTGTLYESTFSVSGNDTNVLISGSATAASGVTGTIIVSPFGSGSPVVDQNFAAGNLQGVNEFQYQYNLSAGTYELGYEFTAPGNAVVPVGFTASTEQVYTAPEIDPASAAAGLTLLIGGLLVFRGRRTMSPKFA